MVKHNNVIPGQHFHKDWARRVKTWFSQPIQKKLRREKRKVKAAQEAPRPASGALRPLVHCQTQKYNAKLKLGRGFTLEELKAAGINAKFAQTVGIVVDHRRTNKCEESLKLNVDRLKQYKEKLIVFPRRQGKVKNGDSSPAETADAQQLTGDIIPFPAKTEALSFAALTEDMRSARGYGAIRAARNDARLVGRREKAAKEREAAKE